SSISERTGVVAALSRYTVVFMLRKITLFLLRRALGSGFLGRGRGGLGCTLLGRNRGHRRHHLVGVLDGFVGADDFPLATVALEDAAPDTLALPLRLAAHLGGHMERAGDE